MTKWIGRLNLLKTYFKTQFYKKTNELVFCNKRFKRRNQITQRFHCYQYYWNIVI